MFALASMQNAINDQMPSDKQYTEQLLVAINIISISRSEWEEIEKNTRGHVQKQLGNMEEQDRCMLQSLAK